ncbi:hypothetical protein CR513_01484, partial [Mucuna pruriens]
MSDPPSLTKSTKDLNYLHLQCLHVKAGHKRWVPQYVKIHLIHVLYPQLTPHQILFHPYIPMILTLVGPLLFGKTLEQSGTWELVSLPTSKKAVGCRWVFTIKVAPNDTVDCLKSRLVAKGYTQVYGLDYGDTFSLIAKITTIRLLLAMATIRHWPLHQLDIKNAFLHGDLDEEIYMEQPPGFVAQRESGLVCKLRRSLYGLKQSPRAWFGKFSQTKDIRHIKYFLGIEVAQSKEGIVISQRKYAFDILQETSMSNCRPIDSPMDPNMKLMVKHGEPYSDLERYRRLVGKLIYLTITIPDIFFVVGVFSVSFDISRRHLDRVYYLRIRETPIYQKSKKQNIVARSSAEVEYRAMAPATCELIWVKQLIQELKFPDVQPMKLYCDNQAALQIASNPA